MGNRTFSWQNSSLTGHLTDGSFRWLQDILLMTFCWEDDLQTRDLADNLPDECACWCWYDVVILSSCHRIILSANWLSANQFVSEMSMKHCCRGWQCYVGCRRDNTMFAFLIMGAHCQQLSGWQNKMIVITKAFVWHCQAAWYCPSPLILSIRVQKFTVVSSLSSAYNCHQHEQIIYTVSGK